MNLMTQSKESDSYLDTGDDASSSIKASTRDPSMLFELIAKRSFRASQNLSNQTSTVLKQRPAFNLASKVDEAAIPGERFLGILMLERKKLMNLKAPNTLILADHWFTSPGLGWGYHEFIPLADLRDSWKGFVMNDVLIVEVEMEAISSTKYFPS
uniref:MATH domain-containing protein n=1 Tax=Brassica oleracea TaxID=3712 RepID=A0A3P6AYX9_BRAOL|nr:unnamed protein product [Brassica oleracea]